MHFTCKLVAALLMVAIRVKGQCNSTVGCFPAIGNIALYRNVTANSTCGENGDESFAELPYDGSGSLMVCSADNPSLAYPPSNINDGNLTTSWQSEINVTDDVTVQLNLEGPMLFESLIIVWSTPRPSAMVIERSSDFGSGWSAYRYFATSCENFFNMSSEIITPDKLFNSTEPVCTEMDSLFTPPTDSEVITFNTSSHNTDNDTEYQTITNLRLRLLGTHADLSIETEIYYGISEWFVYGTCLCNGHADRCTPLPGETGPRNKVFAGCDCRHRTAGNNCEMCEPLYNNAEYMQGTVDSANVCEMCQCYGHADECFYNESINEGQCICNNYTDGIMCDDCVAGFYRGSAMMFTEACIDCGCFLPGVSDPMICNSSTGICFCKLNVDSNVNTYCDTCLDRYWNISNDNPDGCQECLCSFPGSSSTVCDKTSGSCLCNDNYEPPLCTDCMDGFFQDAGNDCTACGCNPVGTINTSCVPPDGQCYCRENITNTRCSAPANGFFARPLDFFVFEAEDASYPDGTNLIFPAVNNPTNFTGLGFLEITMEITDVVFQFSVSISYRYDLVIRYSTPDDGFSVIAVIQSLSPVNTTLQCLNTTTNDVTIEQSIFGVLDVTPNHGAEIIHTMCLEAGVVYEVTFTFLNFGSGTPRLLLDSIVLIPAYTTESNYLNSPEVLPVHEEIAELCIPSVAGQLNPACDLELVFILSVEFFGQVYRCGCNLVGTEVVDSCSVSSGTCVCKEGIGGTLCDRCIPTYFNFSVNGCTACNCFPPGVVDFTTCDPVNGTCVCKLNVDSEVNRICDTCLDGYWNVSSSNPDGCQACQCNSNGSSDLVCDKTFGNCSCYANYTGRTCSECADGYYFYNGQCIQCECHPVGSNHSVCDKTSGQCSCLPNIEGRRCNATQSGFFFRALDYIRFEAENLSYSEVFTEVFPITVNPVYENNFTGRGYITYPDNSNAELRFILTVPKSSQYEIILRYMLSEDTFVIVTINSLMPTINSLDCIEVNDSVNNMESLPLPSKNSFHVIHNACLDEGTEYEVTFFHLSDPANIVTFEVDSIVLIPDFMAISNFYNSSTLQDSQLDSCIPRAAGSVPPGNASCDDIAFSLSVETFGQVFECDCNVTGSRTMLGSQCESNGGYCLCKDGVGGERCNQCLNGYYNFSTNGCTACQCDMNNSISLVCDDDGQCSCTFGITDLQCSECEDGFYNFTSNGCQPCTCEQLGSESNNCDKLNGACDCFDGAIGDLCDACPVGTILTNTTYLRFCEPCRCYNRSDMCRVDTETYNLAAITSDFVELCNGSFPIIDNGWVLEGNGVFTICSTNGLGYNTSVSDVDRIVAPANLRGDLTSSYSLQFSVQLQISQIANLLVNMSMVEICGPGGIECLVGQFQLNSSRLQDDSIILLSIPFRETYWQFKNSPNNQPTYLEFLYTLTDVTSFSFSASHAMVETYYLQSISLYTIISVNSVFRSDVVIVEPMFPVEDCQQCFINYTGRFCENCAEGYYRRPGGLDCIACDCNGLSQSCDPQSGICTECRGNSTGNNCELCSRGFYGDPERNISCLPCDCAGLADSTCELDVDGNQTCTTCPLGRDGRNCEMCADGYFIVQQDLCFQCQCFGNVIPSDDGSICDMEIGTCINCSFNTTGPQCERCLPGYFGDATGESKCSECTCHVNGTEGLCTNERGVGVCTCRDGTTGKDCDQCLPGYWGLHLGGCRPCECCNHSGAVNESCDQITGRRYCLPGVGSEDDTRCCECSPGSYNLEPGIGCQDCGCSVAAISPQCSENGTCMCTDGAVGEKCDECGFEYSGEIPNCQRCPECFDNELEYINELTTNITALTITLNQLISTSTPLDNISDIFSKLDSQLFQAQLALQNMSVTRSNVSLLQNKANDTKTLVDMLKQNFTIVSDLFRSINDSVTNDLQVIRMFNRSIYGTTIADVYNRLENISLKISDLNVSSYNSFQILQQRFEADLDFVSVRSNITESLMRLNATKQSLSIAETLTNSIAEQNLDNRESLSLLFTNISALQSGIQEQLSEAQSYKVLLNSTYFKATALMDALAESEQELLNSSVLIEQLYNYSNSSVNLTTNAITLLRDLHYNVDSLISQTLELLDNITIQQGIVFNATGIVHMANSTNRETLALSTPDIELAQMLAREINSTFLPAAEVTTIATAITNSSVIAQQTLQMAHNASVLVDQISTLVNDTLEKLNASDLLHHHVNNITLPQLLRQREDIKYYEMQISGNLTSLNSSAAKLIEMIDMVLTNAHTIGIDNCDRSIELQANATELCKLTNNLTQQSNELNMSLMNVSSEINNAEEDAIAQLETVQTLYENATALNATAHQVAVQQLQDLLEEYSEDRIRIGQLTETANYLITELDQLIENIEETSATLKDCIRTP